jgi:FkbM family methyltransferase
MPLNRAGEILQDNLSLNHIVNVRAMNEVVGSADGMVRFTELPNASMGSRVATGRVSNEATEAMSYEIKQVALDAYAPVKPSLIKIDTQGYVYQPLSGLKNIIREQKPHLALEIDGKKAIEQYGNNFEKIFDIIGQGGYEFFIQFEAGEQPVAIDFSCIIPEWEKRNQFQKDIHLYARNPERFSSARHEQR